MLTNDIRFKETTDLPELQVFQVGGQCKGPGGVLQKFLARGDVVLGPWNP